MLCFKCFTLCISRDIHTQVLCNRAPCTELTRSVEWVADVRSSFATPEIELKNTRLDWCFKLTWCAYNGHWVWNQLYAHMIDWELSIIIVKSAWYEGNSGRLVRKILSSLLISLNSPWMYVMCTLCEHIVDFTLNVRYMHIMWAWNINQAWYSFVQFSGDAKLEGTSTTWHRWSPTLDDQSSGRKKRRKKKRETSPSFLTSILHPSLSGSPLWAFTFTRRVAAPAPFLEFDYYFFEDVCIWSSGYVKLRPAPYPLVNCLEGSFAIRQV